MKLKVTAQEFKEIFSISTSGSPKKASLMADPNEQKTEEKTDDNDRRGNDNSRNNEEKEKENRDREAKNKNNSASMKPMQPQPVTTMEQAPMQPMQPQPIIAMGQSLMQMQPPNEAQKQAQKQVKDQGKIPYDIDTLVAMQVQAVATANALGQSIQNLSQDAPAQQKPKVPIPPTISPQLSEPDISAQIPTSTAPNLSENIAQTAPLTTDATKTQNFPVQGCIAAVGNENRVSNEKREELR